MLGQRGSPRRCFTYEQPRPTAPERRSDPAPNVCPGLCPPPGGRLSEGGERGEREASSPEGGGKEPCRESGPALHRLEPSHLVPSPLRPDAPAASVLRCGMLSGDPVRCGPEGSLRHQLGRAEPVPRGWPADSLATPTSPPGAHTRALSLCRSTLSFLLVSYGFYYRS